MSAPYTATTVANYNVNPPPDDGSTSAANRVSWATEKTKLADPIKSAFDTSETNTVAAFGKVLGGASILKTGVNYTVLAADQSKSINATASGITITTPDATAVGTPFMFGVRNASTGTITLAGNNPGVQQTVDGNNSIIMQPGTGCILTTDGSNWFSYAGDSVRPFPPPSSYKNLSVKVSGNVSVVIVADDIVVATTGGAFQTLTSLNLSINLGTTGANALDAGVIAIDTWYAIWVIAKPDGTTAGLASTSSSAPTMPSGYTYKARVSWVRTIHASAVLNTTFQFGRRAQYVIGIGNTAALPIVASGLSGSVTVPTWISVDLTPAIPPTASLARLTLAQQASGAQSIAAPNVSYGAYNSTTNPPPMSVIGPSVMTSDITIETSLPTQSVQWASSNVNGILQVLGWEDNI